MQPKIGGFLNDRAVAAEGARVTGEIRISQFCDDHAAGIFALLMHADGTVETVVGDHEDHGHPYCIAVANS